MTERAERLTMSVPEAAAELGISAKTTYNLTHSAGFPALKIGTRTRVSREGLREWVRRQSEQESARAAATTRAQGRKYENDKARFSASDYIKTEG